MIFMVLVGGLGTFEGPIIGGVIFFLIEYLFGQTGVWYLVGLGAAAIVFALFLPRGLWGSVEDKFGIRLLPVGYTLRLLRSDFYYGSQTASPNDRLHDLTELNDNDERT
jgi:branched-chain amino acid transport system permease protein